MVLMYDHMGIASCTLQASILEKDKTSIGNGLKNFEIEIKAGGLSSEECREAIKISSGGLMMIWFSGSFDRRE